MGTPKEVIMKDFLHKNMFILATLIFAFLVRIISINQSFWMDEAISGTVAKSFGFSEIINNFIKSDTHPPLHYLLLRLWALIFGASDLSLRLPSVIFGTLTVFVLFKIAKLQNPLMAHYAALFVSISPLLVYYSQEARMYALTTLLVCIAVYFFLVKRWALYSITTLLLIATDYLPVLILLPLGIFAFFSKEYRQLKIKFGLSHIPLILFLILWFPILRVQQASTLSFVENNSGFGSILGLSNVKNLALVWVKFLIGRINFDPPALYVIVVLTISILVLTPLVLTLINLKKTLLYWLWFTVPILISYIVSLKVPGFSYFRLIFTLPAFILLISYGLTKLEKGKYVFLGIMALQILLTFTYLFNQNFWREDWKSGVPFIEDRLQSGEKVIVSYPQSFTPYDWYSSKAGRVQTFNAKLDDSLVSLYTLDYLMDLTDPKRENYEKLKNLGYKEIGVYNFRGMGQVRYWKK